tara:strand:- start:664 stop:990 length:327 start_codon:yes stop_codon:yes gene_type:complete
MRYADLVTENLDIKDAVLDLLTAMAGEGVESVSIDSLVKELSAQEVDVDAHALFDLLGTLAIVRNVKDNVVYFNADSDQSHYQELKVDPEKQDKTIDKLARKKIKKEI